MTEGLCQSPRIASVLTLNITDWEASSSQDMWRESSGDISPRSKVEDDSNREMPLSSADGSTPPPTRKQEDDSNSNSTTPVPPAKPQFDVVGSNVDLIYELRKIVREEVSEGIQKLAAETHGQCMVSTAVGSVISSSSSNPDNSSLLVAQGESSPASIAPQRPGVRFSDRRTFSKRPAGVPRTSSSSHPHTEWGELFDSDGCATSRLGQVLRGLAKHIIEDYNPKNSLVITPEKLHTFYSKYRVEHEPYTFFKMFASNSGDFNERLADFYEDLECQYHLVQRNVHSKPKIPALTPAGFANYLTTCLLAHPEQEFRRLQQIVSEVVLFVDITTQDGQPEKLPRSIIRSCLPAKNDPRKKKILDLAVEDLLDDLKVQAPARRHTPPTSPSSNRRGSSGALTQSSPDRQRHMPPKSHRTAEEPIIVEEYDSRPPGRKRFTPTVLQSIGDESLVEAYERTPHGDWTRHHVGEQQDKVGAVTSVTTAIGPPRDGGGVKLRDAEDHGPLSAGSSCSHSPHSFSHSNRLPQRPSLSHHQTYGRPHSYTHTGSSPDQQAGSGVINVNCTSGVIPPPPIGPRASSFSFPAPSFPLSSRAGEPHSPTKLRGYSMSVPDVAAGMAGAEAAAAAAAAAALASSPAPSSATAIFRAPSDASSTMTAAHDGAMAAGVYTPASTSSSNNNSEPASPTTAVLDDRYGSSGGAADHTTPMVHNMLGGFNGRRDSTDYDRYHHHPSLIQNHYRLSSGSISSSSGGGNGGGGGGYSGLDGYGSGNGSHGRASSSAGLVNMNTGSTHDAPPPDKHHPHPRPPLSPSSSSSLSTIHPPRRSGGGGSSDRRSEPASPSRHHQKSSSQSKKHGSSSSSNSNSRKRRSMPPPPSLAVVPRSHAHHGLLPSSPSDAKALVAARQPTVTEVPEGADEEEGEAVVVVVEDDDDDDDRGPTWGEYFRGQQQQQQQQQARAERAHVHGGRGQRGYHGGY